MTEVDKFFEEYCDIITKISAIADKYKNNVKGVLKKSSTFEECDKLQLEFLLHKRSKCLDNIRSFKEVKSE